MKHSIPIYAFIVYFVSLAVAFSLPFASGSASNSRASSVPGFASFQKSCSVCHSVRPGETKVGPSLYGFLREGSGHSEHAARQAITNGKGTMPAFNEKLESGEIDNLLAYLKTL